MKKDLIPVLQFDGEGQQLPFLIHSLQWMEEHREDVTHKPHKHNYFVMIYVRSGTGTHTIDLKEYSVQPNTIYFLSPGQLHLFNPSQDIEGMAISFTSEFFCISEPNRELLYDTGVFFSSAQQPYNIPDDKQEEMMWLFARIEEEYNDKPALSADMIRSLLKIIIITVSRSLSTAPAQGTAMQRHEFLTRHFQQLLEENFTKKKQVADYAAMLVITPNHLNEVVKKQTGKPAGEHIRERITLEAKRYIYYTDASLKEIAAHLGFDDEAHFSRFFKNATGSNFSEFKKQLNKI